MCKSFSSVIKQACVIVGTAALVCIASTRTVEAQMLADTTGTIAEHEFVVSGFIGPTFGDVVDDADAGIGGAFTYLRGGMFGGEFIANFTPDLNFGSNLVEDSAVNDFMFNGIAALPLGEQGRFQPFVSAGLGAMTISATIDDPEDLFDVDDTQFAGNVGFGLMGFGDQWGFRAGMRYVSGFDEDPIPGDLDLSADLVDATDVLADVSYWRGDVGVAFRW